jgi:hypothetical protein
VSHRIAAVGSRSVESAQAFVDKLHKLDAPFDWGAKQGKLDGCKVYGSYDGVYNDPVSEREIETGFHFLHEAMSPVHPSASMSDHY